MQSMLPCSLAYAAHNPLPLGSQASHSPSPLVHIFGHNLTYAPRFSHIPLDAASQHPSTPPFRTYPTSCTLLSHALAHKPPRFSQILRQPRTQTPFPTHASTILPQTYPTSPINFLGHKPSHSNTCPITRTLRLGRNPNHSNIPLWTQPPFAPRLSHIP